jgi:DNA-binding transcriptional LysR family regulator
VIPTKGPFLLPPVLSDLRKRYSKLTLYLKEEMSAELVQQLQRCLQLTLTLTLEPG